MRPPQRSEASRSRGRGARRLDGAASVAARSGRPTSSVRASSNGMASAARSSGAGSRRPPIEVAVGGGELRPPPGRHEPDPRAGRVPTSLVEHRDGCPPPLEVARCHGRLDEVAREAQGQRLAQPERPLSVQHLDRGSRWPRRLAAGQGVRPLDDPQPDRRASCRWSRGCSASAMAASLAARSPAATRRPPGPGRRGGPPDCRSSRPPPAPPSACSAAAAQSPGPQQEQGDLALDDRQGPVQPMGDRAAIGHAGRRRWPPRNGRGCPPTPRRALAPGTPRPARRHRRWGAARRPATRSPPGPRLVVGEPAA